MVNIGSGAKREVQEYWLNEPQALLIAMRSDAELAPAVREMPIRVFMAWRQGRIGVGMNDAFADAQAAIWRDWRSASHLCGDRRRARR
jgi:hypothetical protein